MEDTVSTASVADIPEEAVALLDRLIEYLLGLARLEKFRVARDVRNFVMHVCALLAWGAVIVVGFVFASIGLALWIGNVVGVDAAGYGIVGSIYLLAGILCVTLLKRSRSRGGI